MTLYDLKNIIDYSVDIVDNEITATCHIGNLLDIHDRYAQQIDVVKIDHDTITCKLTKFLRIMANYHPTEITDYINQYYPEGYLKEHLLKQLTKRPYKHIANSGDVADDGGDAVYQFITYDLTDLITRGE